MCFHHIENANKYSWMVHNHIAIIWSYLVHKGHDSLMWHVDELANDFVVEVLHVNPLDPLLPKLEEYVIDIWLIKLASIVS